ncbi:MAG: M15 family metallopeptidase [Bacteriovoracaceae bacterium]
MTNNFKAYEQDLIELYPLLKDKKLVHDQENILVMNDIVDDLSHLKKEALNEGIDLTVVSGYRSFERQLSIWNRKVQGELLVHDDQADSVDMKSLSPIEKIHAICRYSAIPGLSRHHLGSEIDVYDKRAVAKDYKLKLEPSEYDQDGPFSKLTEFITSNCQRFNFKRPYLNDLGGVAPEPWHLSHFPSAEILIKKQTKKDYYDFFLKKTKDKGIEFHLLETIVDHFEELYERYFLRVN